MNDLYRSLAYEKTVLQALVRIGKDQLLSRDGEDEEPRVQLVCEDLPQSDNKVPEDDKLRVIHKLERMANKRELELSKYKMVKADYDEEEEEPTSGGSKAKNGAKRRQRKTKGSRSANQSAAH